MLKLATSAAVFGLILAPSSVFAADGGDMDCTDFASQEEAQKHWDEQGYSADNDPERLDRDGDGVPCEDGSSSGGGSDTDDSTETDKEEKGGKMPDTAISQPTFMAVGSVILFSGLGLLLLRRRFNT